ncbi:MAG TPA: sensor histidine kinase [bacterium]|nr:sensor histidine kinase [bacterium]
MLALAGCGIRAVALGVDNLLLGASSASPSELPFFRAQIFHRMVLDPKNDPLSPLFASRDGVAAQAPGILAPFFGGVEPTPVTVKASILKDYEGSAFLRADLEEMSKAGVLLAVWDNCLSGTTSRIHHLIDHHYGGLFPRSRRFLSTSYRMPLGQREFLELVLERLGVTLDELLIVTANPGQRDYALRCGAASLLLRPFDGAAPAPSLLASLATYLGGPIHDPVAFMRAMNDCVNDPEVDRKVRSLPKNHPFQDDVRFVREEIMKRDSACGAIVSDVHCFLVDQRMHAEGGLTGILEGIPPPPHFKSAEAIGRDILDLADGYLAQVERRIPELARSAVVDLIKEVASLCKITDASFLATGIVQEIERRLRTHITLNRRLYVDEARVFHEDEWFELADIFLVDHDALDRRYEKWIVDTERAFREMAARKEDAKAVRRLVKERLVDDLILTVMELEMMVRSFEEGQPRPKLFPRHHGAKNRAATLTLNIGDKQMWKESMLTVKTVHGWAQWMVRRQLRHAKEFGVDLKFTYSKDASVPSLELSDLSELERESLDDILTELITNAVKYRRSNGIPEVRVEVTEGEGAIVFRVEDNGMGIGDVERVLEGFREHPEETEGYGGGLASVTRHLKSHPGWELSVQSQVGVGSLFLLKAVLQDQEGQRKRLSSSGFPAL